MTTKSSLPRDRGSVALARFPDGSGSLRAGLAGRYGHDRLLVWMLFLAMACSARSAAPDRETAAAPAADLGPAVPGAQSSSPLPPLEPGKEDEIESTEIRAAYQSWRAERARALAAEGKTVSHQVVDIAEYAHVSKPIQRDERIPLLPARDIIGEVVVIERIQRNERNGSPGTCEQGTVVAPASLDPDKPVLGKPFDFDTRAVGLDCCPGTACTDRAPAGWMLHYNDVLRARSHDQLRALIDSKSGLEVRVAWATWEDSGEEEVRFTATSSNQDLDNFFIDPAEVLNYLYYDVSCPDAFDDTGTATCNVSAVGFDANYVWRKVGARAYLIRIEERSH